MQEENAGYKDNQIQILPHTISAMRKSDFSFVYHRQSRDLNRNRID